MKLADITDITVDVVKEAFKILKPYGIGCKDHAWYGVDGENSIAGPICFCCPMGAVALAASIENDKSLPVQLNGRITTKNKKLLTAHAKLYLTAKFSQGYQDAFTRAFDTKFQFRDYIWPEMNRGSAAGFAVAVAWAANEFNS